MEPVVKLRSKKKTKDRKLGTDAEKVREEGVLEADVLGSQDPAAKVGVSGGEAMETPHERVVQGGHVVADGDERDAERSRSDKANQSVGVLDGGGVEEGGHHLCEPTHRHEHHLPRNPSQVVWPPRPLHLLSLFLTHSLSSQLRRFLLHLSGR